MVDSTQLVPIDDLVLLVAVADHGGIAAAARSLRLAQPNATRTLRRLERRLGLSLLTRGARGSRLTEHGALVVDWARTVVEASRQLVAGVDALTSPTGPGCSMSASQTIAEDLLPRWLSALRHDLPEVRVALTVCNSREVGERLSGGLDQLGFVESPSLPSTLTIAVDELEVARDRLIVVVSPDHPWARRTRPVPLEEFVRTPLVVREPGSGTRVSLETALAGHTLAAPALELGSNAAVRVAVVSNAAPTVLSELAVQSAVAAGELRAVYVDGLVVDRPLRALWDARQPLPEAARRLLDLAVQVEARSEPPDSPAPAGSVP